MIPRGPQAQLHQVLKAISGELREWVRRRSPAIYQRITDLENSTRLLEDIDCGYGYEKLVERLIWLWEDMRRQWEAGK